jgi:Single-stranded DNA-specific exonuclease
LKQWKQREPAIPYSDNDSTVEKLAKINGITDLKRFLSPSIKDTHHYSLLPNIDDAVNEIHRHLVLGNKIVIYVDVDADGVFSTSIAYRYLKRFSDNIHYFHVQRDDGHGIHVAEHLVPEDTDLLLIVDSSTNDHEACERIKNKGISIVILDHHDFEGTENPHAIIVNPRLPNSKYPNIEASGALVTWKVMSALDDLMDANCSEELMDMAGLSILSDSMSALDPENRYYIKHALENVDNLGLKILLERLKINPKKFNSIDFQFAVSPCITAITRKNEIEIALELFMSDDPIECDQLVTRLVEANEIRKNKQREYVELVKPQINPEDKFIIVVDPTIGKSYNGAVSQTLTDVYKRPAIVLGYKDEKSKQYNGSFRSYGDYPVKDFLNDLQNVLSAAGHMQAGGVRIWKSNLEKLKREINLKLKDHVFESCIEYDLEINSSDINEELIKQVEKFFKVCGKGIKPALFKIKDLLPIDKKVIGKGDTLKIPLVAASDTWFINEEDFQYLNNRFDAMKFKADQEFIETFPIKKEIEIIGTLSINEFTNYRGKTTKTNQIIISEYRVV